MKKNGYTLIEVLVGLLIVTLLFVGGYTAYREFIRRQVLISTGDQLKSNLNLARQRSLEVEKPAGCDTLLGYEVVFAPSSYTVAPKCQSINPGPDFTLTYLLAPSVTISTSDLSTPLLYKSVSGTNLTSNAIITITHTSGESRILTITPEGIIQ